jgi:hypothetical protein
VTLRNFAKLAGFAKKLKRYPIVSLLSIGGEGGFCSHSLKAVGVVVLRQPTKCSGVWARPQEQVSLAPLWLNLV